MDTEALPTTGLPTLRRADGSPGEWVLGDDVSIGRPEGRPTVALDDSTVSRRHASISYREGRWWIADQGSTNGTFVNGARVTTAELHSGDAVRLGRVDLAFTVGAPGTTGSPASAGPSYTVGSQSGTVNNVGANQYNYNRRGSLEWIATKKAGRGMIWAGVIMLFLG
ncbi:MAG TPA: FHA domain-containing protein, partial [Actinomycetota bacterium]|nr:FHA domain-containing protein [Actinomycetota bacterium]